MTIDYSVSGCKFMTNISVLGPCFSELISPNSLLYLAFVPGCSAQTGLTPNTETGEILVCNLTTHAQA